MAGARPADECPYGRPLPERFDACPAFHPVRFVPLNSQHVALQPVLTCRHMEVALRADQPGRAYYCRCAIGDGQARLELTRLVSERRRRLMRELADGLMEIVAANWETLGAVKGRELAAATQEERRAAQAEVAAAADFIEAEMMRLVEGSLRGHVDELGIQPGALVAVIRAGVRDFETNGFASWTPPEDLLRHLPADVAAFLSPSRAHSAA